MREPMHPIYTTVPARSVVAYAKSVPAKLEEVLCAAIVDPANAEDAFEEYGVSGTPHSLQDFWDWRGAIGVDLALGIAARWALSQKNAEIASSYIVKWNHRLGVWCASQVSRRSLGLSRGMGDEPRIAIETAEMWVIGKATEEQAIEASQEAFIDAESYGSVATTPWADRSVIDEAYAASHICHASGFCAAATRTPYLANVSITMTARAMSYASDQKYVRQDVERRILVRLREDVANACMTFPRYYSR
jgi:hypothetical protein